jgi:hypothetical protein
MQMRPLTGPHFCLEAGSARAFSSEVASGPREENASKNKDLEPWF